jgi:hypothetical protein
MTFRARAVCWVGRAAAAGSLGKSEFERAYLALAANRVQEEAERGRGEGGGL